MINKEYLQKHVPSALAAEHDGARSEIYSFISTEGIINELDKFGFSIRHARQAKIRKDKEIRLAHCKHRLVFENPQLNFPDPRKAGNLIPTILLTNSSDGTSSYIFNTGLFAMICTNGLTIKVADFGNYSTRHINANYEQIRTWIDEYITRIPEYKQLVESLASITLTPEQAMSFATEAVKIRWNGELKVDPAFVLQSRRDLDMGNSLWNIFNRVQENLMQGGYKAITNRNVRMVKGIDSQNDINNKLWNLTERYINDE